MARNNTGAPVDLIMFHQAALHRVAPARANGWRFFFRLSLLPRPPQNLLRRQVQVYAPLGQGW